MAASPSNLLRRVQANSLTKHCRLGDIGSVVARPLDTKRAKLRNKIRPRPPRGST